MNPGRILGLKRTLTLALGLMGTVGCSTFVPKQTQLNTDGTARRPASPPDFHPIACATDVVKAIVGTWNGDADLIPPQGVHLQHSGTRDVFEIQDCNTFVVTVNYLDSSGNIARILHFNAVADQSVELGFFTLVNGTITEGTTVSPMTGTIRVPQIGTLLGHFSGTTGGKAAYLSEVMTVSGNQLVRTIQMYAGDINGAYLGTRIVRDLIVR